MKKTLLLALSLGVLVGCADDSADVVDTDTTVVEPAVPVTEPADDMVDDSMMVEEPMMDEAVEGDAGMDETDDMVADTTVAL